MLETNAMIGGDHGSGYLSLDPSLAAHRKRTCPSTDSLDDGHKRMHEFTESVPDNCWQVASSPPLSSHTDDDGDAMDFVSNIPVRHDTDGDMDTDDDEAPGTLSQNTLRANTDGSRGLFSFNEQSTPRRKLGAYRVLSIATPAQSAPYGAGAGGSMDTSHSSRVPLNAARARKSLGSFGSFPSFGSFGSSLDTSVSALVEHIIDNPDSVADAKGAITLSLENRGITELPDVIGDLRDLVFFGNQTQNYTLQIYLSKNRLNFLPLSLFELDRLTVLSLRDNELTELSPLLANLTNLRELHLSGNCLTALPAELLQLPLTTLTAWPNQLLPLPEGIEAHSSRSHMIYSCHSEPAIPSLQEFAMRSLAKNAYSGVAAKFESLPTKYRDLLDVAIRAYTLGRRCSHCHEQYVEHSVETVEWWNIFGQSAVPYRRLYCQPSCWVAGSLKPVMTSSSPSEAYMA